MPTPSVSSYRESGDSSGIKFCTRKTCPLYGTKQPLNNFYTCKNGSFGYSSWCKACTLLYAKRPPREPRNLRPAPEGFKICCSKSCSHNGEIQLVGSFAKSKRRIDGLHHTCKDCVKEAAIKRKQRNLEKFNDPALLFAEGKTKVCSRKDCIHQYKQQPTTNFYRHSASSDGLNSECKDCCNVHVKQWQESNPETFAAGRRRYAETHIEQTREYHRINYAEIKKPLRIENWAEFKIIQIQRRASKKGLPFNIDQSDLSPLPKFCSVFGLELDYAAGRDRRFWASVDRIKPESGYVKGNVRIISMAANAAKFDGDGDLITRSSITN